MNRMDNTKLPGAPELAARLPTLSMQDWLSFSTTMQQVVDETLLAGSRQALTQLEPELTALVRGLFQAAPKSVRDGVAGHTMAPSDAMMGFVLGEASLAQALVTNARRKSAEENLIVKMQQDPYACYLELLNRRELTNTQLAAEFPESRLHSTTLSPTKVSRDLAVLRQFGVTDVRRVGRESFNYLTSLGREVLNTFKGGAIDGNGPRDTTSSARIRALKEVTDPRFKERPNYGLKRA